MKFSIHRPCHQPKSVFQSHPRRRTPLQAFSPLHRFPLYRPFTAHDSRFEDPMANKILGHGVQPQKLFVEHSGRKMSLAAFPPFAHGQMGNGPSAV